MVDLTAPTLTALDLPDVVDLSNGDITATFSASGSDENEIDSVVIWFDKPFPQNGTSFSLFGIFSGWVDGLGSRSLTFDDAMNPGTYNVTSVDIKDVVGNVRKFTATELSALGFDTKMLVTNANAVSPTPDFEYQIVDAGGQLYLHVVNVGAAIASSSVDFDVTLRGSGYSIGSFSMAKSGAFSSSMSSSSSGTSTTVHLSASAAFSGTLNIGQTLFRIALDVTSPGAIETVTSALSIRSTTQLLPKLLTHNIGTTAADTLHGTSAADTMYGFSGDDTVFGYQGNDVLNGGNGADTVNGGSGDDEVSGGGGDDMLDGGGGSDQLFGQQGNDTLIGGFANDFLFGGSGNDDLSGGESNDQLFGGSGADTMDGGNGSDLFVVDGFDTVTDTGTGGYDKAQIASAVGDSLSLAGWSGVERVNGNAGNDQIDASTASEGLLLFGDGGDDTLIGGLGGDVLIGGDGNDTLTGNDGNDIMLGAAGNDTFDGGAGNDVFYMGESGDVVSDGGAGFDKAVIYDTNGLSLNVGSWVGVERIMGLTGGDTIDATGMAASVTLVGGAGNDVLTGGSDADVFFGGADDDNLLGAAGDDALIAGAGNDTLDGGAGNDFLFGGAGTDAFVWTDRFGRDVVKDFTDGVDRLDFSGHSSVNALSDLTITQSGNHTIVAMVNGTDQVTLADTLASTVTGADFDFV